MIDIATCLGCEHSLFSTAVHHHRAVRAAEDHQVIVRSSQSAEVTKAASKSRLPGSILQSASRLLVPSHVQRLCDINYRNPFLYKV